MQHVDLVPVDGLPLDAVIHSTEGGPPVLEAAILADGITADMDEGGMFARLADHLTQVGFAVLRFSFRGHGGSGGAQRGVTIAGELLDLQATIEFMARRCPGRLSIVATSFGAVSAALSLPWLVDRLSRLVLWHPVLDLAHTFVDPELPWGIENFGPNRQRSLYERGQPPGRREV